MREKYWKVMTGYRFTLYYLDEHFFRYTRYDRYITIFLAIASSTAIANWAIWQTFDLLWGVIIGLSQLMTVVNQFLPYKKRVQQIAAMRAKLSALYVEIESLWNKVDNEQLPEEEINTKCYNFIKKWTKIEDDFFKDDCLPEPQILIDRADRKKNDYFEKLF